MTNVNGKLNVITFCAQGNSGCIPLDNIGRTYCWSREEAYGLTTIADINSDQHCHVATNHCIYIFRTKYHTVNDNIHVH